MTKYMTITEVASALEVPRPTIARWVRDGTLPSLRFGPRVIKIPRTEIDNLQNQNQKFEDQQ
jgi:excisionase family DNA binding protein